MRVTTPRSTGSPGGGGGAAPRSSNAPRAAAPCEPIRGKRDMRGVLSLPSGSGFGDEVEDLPPVGGQTGGTHSGDLAQSVEAAWPSGGDLEQGAIGAHHVRRDSLPGGALTPPDLEA